MSAFQAISYWDEPARQAGRCPSPPSSKKKGSGLPRYLSVPNFSRLSFSSPASYQYAVSFRVPGLCSTRRSFRQGTFCSGLSIASNQCDASPGADVVNGASRKGFCEFTGPCTRRHNCSIELGRQAGELAATTRMLNTLHISVVATCLTGSSLLVGRFIGRPNLSPNSDAVRTRTTK